MIPSRQIIVFGTVGIAAAAAHYGVLIGLVEGARWAPVSATLCGYLAGGIVSYALNRRLTFESRRTMLASAWRFAAVAGVGFLLTGVLMAVLVDRWAVPYLLAQLGTTASVLVWSFVAHKLWTFDDVIPL